LILIQDNPATIFSIANTGAMLSVGQERSKEIAALAAEQAVLRFSCCTTIEITADSEGVPGSYNHPEGAAGA
jgi:hypothetical protein